MQDLRYGNLLSAVGLPTTRSTGPQASVMHASKSNNCSFRTTPETWSLDSIPTSRYLHRMAKNTGENCREKLLGVGTDLMRRSGYAATTVDEICTSAGVTKGAFFHHFPSKEALAAECLAAWPATFGQMQRTARSNASKIPQKKSSRRSIFSPSFFLALTSKSLASRAPRFRRFPKPTSSPARCGAGVLRRGEAHFKTLLDDACQFRGVTLDTTSLAEHWMGTMQGSLLLWPKLRAIRALSLRISRT